MRTMTISHLRSAHYSQIMGIKEPTLVTHGKNHLPLAVLSPAGQTPPHDLLWAWYHIDWDLVQDSMNLDVDTIREVVPVDLYLTPEAAKAAADAEYSKEQIEVMSEGEEMKPLNWQMTDEGGYIAQVVGDNDMLMDEWAVVKMAVKR